MKKKIIGYMLPVLVALSGHAVAQQSDNTLQNVDNLNEKVHGITILDKPSSINPNHIESDFSIYPNPNAGRFNVRVPLNTKALKIYSTNGQEVFSYFPERSAELIPIDISKLGPSIYFVMITGEEIQKLIRLVVTK